VPVSVLYSCHEPAWQTETNPEIRVARRRTVSQAVRDNYISSVWSQKFASAVFCVLDFLIPLDSLNDSLLPQFYMVLPS